MSGYLRVAMALSVAGMVILPVFGLLLRFQPRFVHGLHVDSSKAELNCYIAAGVYGVVFMICAITLCIRARQRTQLEQQRLDVHDKMMFGKSFELAKPKTKNDQGEGAARHDSRTSSREDTAIILDSPLESEPTPL